MILIAHRGNTSGAKPLVENDPVYIKLALEEGFDAEVDVWFINGNYILGHDSPQYFVKESFLEDDRLWCHAKTPEALKAMVKNKKIHCFWHQKDDVTLTSRNIIWTYPKKKLLKGSACVMPELGYNGDLIECCAICSDYIKDYKK